MISKACVRDVSYIGAHMRQHDKDEIMCQVPDGYDPRQAALLMFDSAPEDCRYVAYDRDSNPVLAFGWTPTVNPTLWSAWAFGTKGMKRTIPEATDFILRRQLPHMMRKYRPKRLEVRALVGHDVAHRWLEYMGAQRECVCPRLGAGGEDFVLYSWTDRTIWSIHEKWVRRKSHTTKGDRSQHHVFLRQQHSETPASSTTAVGT